ncbi:DUF262 domain-containing protein [Helicobacter cetorum]|uniref:DUF262 domain-containing protein n=1 Tax=Helicobacter cetorum TaxID=138563 RepID=UPI000CF10D78|nr:DUF262 domain-containing protein [Helicobacter cetorum]
MNGINAELLEFYNLFNKQDSLYQVPKYQRPYVWKEEQLNVLIEDLSNAYENDRSESYFCGSIVLHKKEGRLDIIDGQQRLTTLIILACVLNKMHEIKELELDQIALKYLKDSIYNQYSPKEPILTLSTHLKKASEFEIELLQSLDFKEKAKKDNRYLENAHHFKTIIDELKTRLDINEFIKFIYGRVVFSVIVCSSLDSAIRIFNTLNSRGLSLSYADILKSELMGKSTSIEEQEKFDNLWEDIRQDLNNNSKDFEYFLTLYLYYVLEKNPTRTLDKELLEIFKRDNRFDKGILNIANEIKDFSKSYKNLIVNQKTNSNAALLSYLKHSVYYQSILCSAYFTNYDDTNGLEKLLVQYYYQNWLKGGSLNTIKQTSFNIIKDIKNKSSLSDIKNKIKENLNITSSQQLHFLEVLKLENNFYKKPYAKALLLLIEYESLDNPKIYSLNECHIEHVLPQNPKENSQWCSDINELDRENYTNSLGNCTLLAGRKNVQASNKEFPEKCQTYTKKDNKNTSFLITQLIATNYSKWDIQSILSRKEELLKIIEKALVI